LINIWKNNKNFLASKPLDRFLDKEVNILEYKEKNKIQGKTDIDEYKNTIFYPSNKE